MNLGLTTPVAPHYTGRNEIPGLQILKFICALFVIQIHTESLIKPYILPICRIAVPVFFIISGYFLLGNDGLLSQSRLRRTLWKIIKITIAANAVYIVFKLSTCILHPERFATMLPSVKGWIGFLVIGERFCVALWYLTAYIEALIVLYLALRFRCVSLIYIAAVAGLAANLILGKYSFIYNDAGFATFVSRNVVTIGLPCIAIGMFIRRNEHLLPSLKAILISAFIIGGMLMCENFILSGKVMGIKNPGDITIFTVPLAILVFTFFLKAPHRPGLDLIAGMGRTHSLNIYIYHLLVYAFVTKFVSEWLSPFYTFITMAAVIALSVVIERCRRRPILTCPGRQRR